MDGGWDFGVAGAFWEGAGGGCAEGECAGIVMGDAGVGDYGGIARDLFGGWEGGVG